MEAIPTPLLFQSAPLTEARGDRVWVGLRPLDALFQSAPLTEARGDVLLSPSRTIDEGVSIRSPDRSQGRSHTRDFFSKAFPVSIRSPDRSQGR